MIAPSTAPSTPTSEHRARPRTSPDSPIELANSDIAIRLSPVSSPSASRTEGTSWCGREKATPFMYFTIAALAAIIVVVAFVQLNPSHSLSVKSPFQVEVPQSAHPSATSVSRPVQIQRRLIVSPNAPAQSSTAAKPAQLIEEAANKAAVTGLDVDAANSKVASLPSYDPMGVDPTNAMFFDVSVGERTDNERDFSQNELQYMIRAHEPRYVQLVAELEKVGRLFTSEDLKLDGVELRRTPGRGVGLFATQNYKVGDLIPPERVFESMHFDGCPPTIAYHVDCEAPGDPDSCDFSGIFTCSMHTDLTQVHNISSFTTSFDFDLLINHGLDAPFNVKTRQWRRIYRDPSMPPRVINRFEVIHPIRVGEELLSNYLLYLDDESECRKSRKGMLDCIQPHSGPLPMWRPRRLQPDGSVRELMPPQFA